MSLIKGCLSRTATTAADMDAARAEHLPIEEMRAAREPALVDPERVAEQAVLAAVAFMHSQAQIGHDITGALACVMERQEHLASIQARRRHPAAGGPHD